MKKEVICRISSVSDARKLMVHIGEAVLCRMPFPRTATLIAGTVEKVKAKDGVGYVKIKGNKLWFDNDQFYKLADK